VIDLSEHLGHPKSSDRYGSKLFSLRIEWFLLWFYTVSIYFRFISHDGSMVLLFMLALIYQHQPDPSWVIMAIFNCGLHSYFSQMATIEVGILGLQ
jgi:hypothetical protein